MIKMPAAAVIRGLLAVLAVFCLVGTSGHAEHWMPAPPPPEMLNDSGDWWLDTDSIDRRGDYTFFTYHRGAEKGTPPSLPNDIGRMAFNCSTGDTLARQTISQRPILEPPIPMTAMILRRKSLGATGATFPIDSFSTNPAENVEGGFWRIAFRGSDAPTNDWYGLTKPGDIVRVDWIDGLYHTFTVMGNENADGSLPVFDNGGGIISIKPSAKYESNVYPQSVTIYRLTTDDHYLINGSDHSETMIGTNFNDLITASAGNDTIEGGLHHYAASAAEIASISGGGAGPDLGGWMRVTGSSCMPKGKLGFALFVEHQAQRIHGDCGSNVSSTGAGTPHKRDRIEMSARERSN